MTSFEFSEEGLAGIQVLARLVTEGISISVAGPGIDHTELVTLKSNPSKLDQAEWMIRASFPNARERALLAAEEYLWHFLSKKETA